MYIQTLPKYSVLLILLFTVLNVHGQAIPIYVDEVAYSTNIDYVNEDNIYLYGNIVVRDFVDGSAPSATLTPTPIRNIKGALIDGYHRDNSGLQYYSFDNDTNINGIDVLKSDIIRCDNFSCSAFNFYFDAATHGFGNININAFTIDVNNGDLIFSIDGPGIIDFNGYMTGDLIRFDGSSFTLEHDSTITLFGGVGVYKNINALSMLSTGEYVVSLADDGYSQDGFSYYNHWLLKYSPQNGSWGWFYTIFSFGDAANPIKIQSLMVHENDLIFKNGFD